MPIPHLHTVFQPARTIEIDHSDSHLLTSAESQRTSISLLVKPFLFFLWNIFIIERIRSL